MTDSTTAKAPPALFPDADSALASGDTRKMFELSFKGVNGSVFAFATTEHQARLAFLDNVTTVQKVSQAERAKMVAAAYSKLLREKAARDQQATQPTHPAPAEAAL